MEKINVGKETLAKLSKDPGRWEIWEMQRWQIWPKERQGTSEATVSKTPPSSPKFTFPTSLFSLSSAQGSHLSNTNTTLITLAQ